ncbi:hypothetical protein [Nocardioides plantarum]|uniref:Lipoprotein n=1 Tax=Nocardioides plantarum TaxID=29299 RepID=A0ABV5KAZ6_9ACTN|nr:hypothetical protein [Nocardioides plantarum]
MRTAIPAVLTVVVLAGCGGVNHPPGARQPHATDPAATSSSGGLIVLSETSDPSDPAAPEPIAFTGTVDLVEGVWFLGRDLLDLPDDPTAGQRNGLLGASGGDIVDIFSPALYGQYRVEVRELDRRPPVLSWCEDVVEVSYRHRGGQLVMGGFEDDQQLGRLTEGSYRVRLCVEGLDRVVAETEEEEFQTYSSRWLFQLWPARRAPDRVLRVGSTFAEEAHAGVRG